MQDNKKSENCLKFTWLKTIFSSKYKDKRHKKITSGKVSRLGTIGDPNGELQYGWRDPEPRWKKDEFMRTQIS